MENKNYIPTTQVVALRKLLASWRRKAKQAQKITTATINHDCSKFGLKARQFNKPFSKQTHQQITETLFQRHQNFTWDNVALENNYFDQGWNYLTTNYHKHTTTPRFKWKTYIPFSDENYAANLQQLVLFLNQQKMVSNLRFSGAMRNDAVRVHLENEADVDKLTTFVSDPELRQNLIAHNPFLPDRNGLGVVYDPVPQNSYEQNLALQLAAYINFCQKEARPDLISLEGFYAYEQYLAQSQQATAPEAQQILSNLNQIVQPTTTELAREL